MECPICKRYKNNHVVFDCNHKICLGCYNDSIKHNHVKCCLCRKKNVYLEHISLQYQYLSNNLDISQELNVILKEQLNMVHKEYSKLSNRHIKMLENMRDTLIEKKEIYEKNNNNNN